ncbi:mononuclear molybdenum enzyme YedY, partial [Burkholderia pseudomallei]
MIKKTLRAALAGDDLRRSESTPRGVLEHRRRMPQAAGAAAAGGRGGAHGRGRAACARRGGAGR